MSAAAGLIAGTVPTTGTASTSRTMPNAMVLAVLQAMQARRGWNRSAHAPQQSRHPRRNLRLGLGAIGQAGKVRGVDDLAHRGHHLAQRIIHRQPADAGIEQQEWGRTPGPSRKADGRAARIGQLSGKGLSFRTPVMPSSASWALFQT